MERVILHVDINNFYASVECLYRPELRDVPMAVGGDPEQRHGIVLAKNNIAKQAGVKTGEALWQAREKCPEIVFVKPDFKKYKSFSKMAKEICYSYTDCVEGFGPDENWLDVTGSIGLFGDGEKIANSVRKRMKEELGITVSVGVSFNKVFAKLGSDLKKPDAVTIISRDNFKNIVWPLPGGEMLFVGRRTMNRLARLNINTIGDIARADTKVLRGELGKQGELIRKFARGEDNSPVCEINFSEPVKSVGNGVTLPYDIKDCEDIKLVLIILSESVAFRMREKGISGRTVQLTIKDCNFNRFDRQKKLSGTVSSSEEIYKTAQLIYNENKEGLPPVRSLTVRVCDMEANCAVQMALGENYAYKLRNEKLDETVVDIRTRFGYESIKRGILFINKDLSVNKPKINSFQNENFLKQM